MRKKRKIKIRCPKCYGNVGLLYGVIECEHLECKLDYVDYFKGAPKRCSKAVPLYKFCTLCKGRGYFTPKQLVKSGWGDNFEVAALIHEAEKKAHAKKD